MKSISQIGLAASFALLFQLFFVLSFTSYFYRPLEMVVFFVNLGVSAAAITFIRLKMEKKVIVDVKNEASKIPISICVGFAVGIGCLFIGEFVFPFLYGIEIWFIVTLFQFLVSLKSKRSGIKDAV